MKNKWPTTLVLVAIVVGAVVACGSSAVNERCLVYNGGVTQTKDFRQFLEKGTTNANIGLDSDSYCYRTDQRSYIGEGDGTGVDAPAIKVVSKDQIEMLVDYQLYFKLNLDDNVMKSFHENLGLKTKAYEAEGWNQMLKEYFKPQIERAAEAAALNFGYKELYGSDEARRRFNDDMATKVKQFISDGIGNGANYFCGPSYEKGGDCGNFTVTVGKPNIANPNLVASIENEQTQVAQTQAQIQENLKTEEKLKVEADVIAKYGPEGALIWKAIESGKITFMVLPDGTPAVVPTPAPTP